MRVTFSCRSLICHRSQPEFPHAPKPPTQLQVPPPPSTATMSLYETVVPLFVSGLETYDHILEQAEAYAKEKGLDVDATFFNARLVDDQLPLSFQVQNTTSLAQINLGRLIGEDITPFEKDEKTVADLRKRVQKTLEFLKGADAAKAAGKEGGEVDL